VNQILIDRDYCKGCGLCIRACRQGVLAMGKERSKGDYLMPYAAAPEKCVGCGLCELFCPDVCIRVEKKEAGHA